MLSLGNMTFMLLLPLKPSIHIQAEYYTPVSMVCANISSPSSGAGGSSDASGGSFRHSWASCMLDVIHEDHPWESQLPSNKDIFLSAINTEEETEEDMTLTIFRQ